MECPKNQVLKAGRPTYVHRSEPGDLIRDGNFALLDRVAEIESGAELRGAWWTRQRLGEKAAER